MYWDEPSEYPVQKTFLRRNAAPWCPSPGSCCPSNVFLPQVTAYETSGRDGTLPGLLHTTNSSKVEFVLAGAAPRGNSSWFALEMATVEEAGVVQRLRSARSIDDEYTPTIFEVSAGRTLGTGTSPAALLAAMVALA